MSEFIEVRSGIPFELDGDSISGELAANGTLRFSSSGAAWFPMFGGFVHDVWEVVRPYPTSPFSETVDRNLIAVLVKRSKRYLTAVAASAFIKAYDLHEEEGPVHLQALFRSLGGTVIHPGGISSRDDERFPGRTARIHGPGDISLFLREGEDRVHRRELMALTIAAQQLQSEIYEDGYYRGPRDLCLGDARQTHPEEHFFAAMLLVPEDYAARASTLTTARTVGRDLLVDTATVQDAFQLWALITNPEQPKF
ncbi:hypothetical protein [Pseudarthrobacter sp. BIM B-2242]|uniref:hypothetical protein n=1 Tax=Pseudarthrobacter sp. BIM B-2242 TaxID=2772401 RepID=UPI00168A8B55|nr:hypothetical protein [Pseudarthrobacter sp. BIM B-2242]QOD06048.1 hypothetical protein IDT60_21015 [Pseudarthrobacter sp. BIM B-2242]